MEKRLMLGNEALARGAWEAGVKIISSYPGTPSTEITEFAAEYPEIYAEWAANEKVALEVATGAEIGGARALCCMKHVGLNVAADPLYTVSYTGVNAGLVVVVADDPGMHSSQNEQDSRNHARASLTPMLEPADSEECARFMKRAFEISEKYDTPVLVRTTTRIAHARSLVALGEREERPLAEYRKDIRKNVMMPAMAKGRHKLAQNNIERLAEDACEMPELNRVEMRGTQIGVVCSGAAYQYVREALPYASVLKLGLVHPLPRRMIETFAAKVEKLYVFEELEPVFEEQIASWGIPCEGKALTGRFGELSVRKIRDIMDRENPSFDDAGELVSRPPVMCPGCPHRGPYAVIHAMHLTATGDIGCYTLGALEPLSAIDTSLCMGASIGMAQGFQRARGDAKKPVAVIGDSTFVHSGITGLVSAVYNRANVVVMILDNTTTGMTGHQPNPATGFDIHGEPTTRLSLEKLCEACGADSVRTVDSFDMAGLKQILSEEVLRPGVSVVICRRPCALLDKKAKHAPLVVDASKCKRCLSCMRLGCPAIVRTDDGVRIDPTLCVGCTLCEQTCAFGAIGKAVDTL